MIKRRTMIKTLGAITAGVATPSVLNADVLARPYKITEKELKTDVLVIGGGTAGTIAAIMAGRAGCDTILVENNSQLGGTTTIGGVDYPGIFHAWGKQVIDGIGWELVSETVKLNGDELPDFTIPHGKHHWKHQVRVNTHVYAMLAEEKCLEAGVKIRYYETPVTAEFKNGRWIVEVRGKGTYAKISCHQLIDCTGNAFVASMAGFDVLREAEIQPGTLNFKLDGYTIDKLDLELIRSRYSEEVRKGNLDKKEFLRIDNLLNSGGNNTQHIAGADSTTSQSHTIANIKGRKSLLNMLRFLKTLPGLEKIQLQDMQTETAVRETYRIDGLYRISVDDYVRGKIFEDSVSYSYYPIDLHDEEGVRPDHLEEGVVATVPLRALIPKHSRNFLVAGRCVSSDRLANSALRVQASCMAMGQAAGAAAVLAHRKGASPGDLPFDSLAKLIKEHNGIVPEKY